MNILPSATKLRKGNIFTPVCQSFCSHGRGCIPACIRADTTPLGRHILACTGADTALGRHITAYPSPGQTYPSIHWGRHPVLPRWLLQRTVRILLECILVSGWNKFLSERKFRLKISIQFSSWTEADPGFPRGWGAISQGRATIQICQIFPKTAWNWKNLDPRGGGALPLDPLLLNVFKVNMVNLTTDFPEGHQPQRGPKNAWKFGWRGWCPKCYYIDPPLE